MAEITINISKYDELEARLQKDIQTNFGRCYKLIARAKWKQKFNTRHYASKTYGRWNK